MVVHWAADDCAKPVVSQEAGGASSSRSRSRLHRALVLRRGRQGGAGCLLSPARVKPLLTSRRRLQVLQLVQQGVQVAIHRRLGGRRPAQTWPPAHCCWRIVVNVVIVTVVGQARCAGAGKRLAVTCVE